MKPVRLVSAMQWLLVAIVATMPFHAFLSIAAGHWLGHQNLWQAWKEVATLFLAAGSVWLLIANRTSRKKLKSHIVILAAAFIVWAGLVSLFNDVVTQSSFWYGVKTDLEFLILGLVAYLISSRKFSDRLIQTVLVTTAILVVIVLLEVVVLPSNWLNHFGYSTTTIVPVQHIAGSTAQRYFATTGGPNQLGAYLILPICLIISGLFKKRSWWLWGLLGGSVAALWLTFSRSALLGAAAAGFTVIYLNLKSRKQKNWLLIGGVIVAAIGLFGALKLDNHLHDLISHGPGQTILSQSDNQRINSLKNGVSVATKHPLGEGLGTAGPASFHNAHAIITEDFYLQLAIETGLIGLGLFTALVVAVGRELLRRSSSLTTALLATLIGISLVNFFLHGLADSTLALVFAALTGSVLGLTPQRLEPHV